MPILTSGGAAQRLTLFAIVALLAVACYPDRVSSPVSAPASPVRSANDPPPPATTVVVNLPVSPTNWDGGALNNFDTGIIIQPYQNYLLKLEGRITVTDNPVALCNTAYKPPYGAEGSYGPGGTGGAWGSLRYATNPGGLNLDNGGAGGSSVATSDSLGGISYSQGLVVSRSALSLAGNCGSTQFGYYILGGSPTLTVTFLDGEEMTIDPKVVFVKRGTKVTFTARSRGTIVGSPMWRFIKSDALPDSTTLCGSANPCDVIARNNGTLRVTKFLYNAYRSDAAAIRVYTNFTLDADKNSVNYGDTVTFTPKIDGVPGNADRWQWVPDSASVNDSTACAPGTGACRKRMTASGTMWAYANQDSASAHVTVRPPTMKLTTTNVEMLDSQADTFTVAVSGGVAVQGWDYRVGAPDSPPVLASRTPVSMGRSQPRANSAQPATPAGPAKQAAIGGTWGACGPGEYVCIQGVPASGWVYAVGTVDGLTLHDSVYVTVFGLSHPDAAADPVYPLTPAQDTLVREALTHWNTSDTECANLHDVELSLYQAGRIKYYVLEGPGPWAVSRYTVPGTGLDPNATTYLASKNFSLPRQLALTLLHEGYHIWYRRSNTYEAEAEEAAQRCYQP